MLSEEKVKELAEKMPRGFLWSEGCEWESGVLIQEAIEFARAIEAAVLAEQEKAGPVAWLSANGLSASTKQTLGGCPLYLHPAPAPEGMVMVPREPTEAILKAARDTADKHLIGDYSNEECNTDEERADKSNKDYWLAMIAAAEKEAGKCSQ